MSAAAEVIAVVGVGALACAWLADMLKGLRDAIRFAITTRRMRTADELLEAAAAERFDPELDALEREHRAELEAFDHELARERQKRLGGTVTRDAWAWQCNMCGAFISMDRKTCDCGHVRPKAGRAFCLEPKTQHAAPIETGYLRAARRNKPKPAAGDVLGYMLRTQDEARAVERMLGDAVEDAEELARRVREKIRREGIEGF